MMNKNKLTLKALKAELELMKASKALKPTNNMKKSYLKNINTKFRENSMFMLYIFSGILAYAHKIPFIGRIISLLSVWYGRTTWWKILIKIRKLFILFNAAIGVLMVYKTVGFSPDNILAGFSAMGYSYIEIFTSATKRLFNWFVELFDHKVVPNVPGEKPNLPKYQGMHYPRGIDMSWNQKLPKLENISSEWIKNPFNLNVTPTPSPWYKDLSTWMWIFGTVGALYFGYKFIIDPLFIQDLGKSGPGTNSPGPSGLPQIITGSESPPITLGSRVSEGLSNLSKSIGKSLNRVHNSFTNKLNPFNWFLSANELQAQFQTFMEKQNVMETADRSLYPFTEINPYSSYFNKLKTSLFGESISESLQRFKDRAYAERIYSSLQVSKGKFRAVDGLTPVTSPGGYLTPSPWIGNLGIGVSTPSYSFSDAIHNSNIENLFNSLTPTPKTIPISLPNVSAPGLPEFVGGNSSWSIHEKDTSVNAEEFMKSWKNPVKPTPGQIVSTSSSKLTIDIPATHNKYSVLTIE